MLGQLFDRVAPIPKDAFFPVDVGDLALRLGRIAVSAVERDEPRVASEAADVESALALCSCHDREADHLLTVDIDSRFVHEHLVESRLGGQSPVLAAATTFWTS